MSKTLGEKKMSESLGEAFPKAIDHCKFLQNAYKEIGPPGIFAYTIITDLIRKAEIANRNQDVVAMAQLYPELQGCR